MTVNTLGSHEQYRSSRTVAEWLWPFLPMGIAMFSLSAVFWYHQHRDTIEVRAPLQRLYAGVYGTFGLMPSVLFFLLVLIWATIWLATGKLDRPFSRLSRLVVMLVMLGIFLNIGDGGVDPAEHKGALGAWLAKNLVGTFSYVPSLIVVWAMTFASFLLATDFFFHDAFERLRSKPVTRAPDVGVEVAVTDHLRGLSGAATRAPGLGLAAAAPIDIALESTAVEAPAETDAGSDGEAFAAADPELQPASDRSWSERRSRRERWAAEPVGEPAASQPEAAQSEAAQSEAALPELAPPQAVEPEFVIPEPAAEAEAETEARAIAEPSEPEPTGEPQAEFAAADLVLDGALDVSPADDAEDADEPAPATPASEPPDRYETAEAIEAAEPEPLAPGYELPDEPLVAIPRPEPAPAVEAEIIATAPLREPEGEAESQADAEAEPRGKQQQLFGGGGIDDGLVQDAIDVVVGSRRASAAFLQRKLRIDYPLAVELLAELAARGVVAIEGDATQGRVLG